MKEMFNITVKVNGTVRNLDVTCEEKLCDTIREKLHLTGTKKSCGKGVCGSCTVLLDGIPVNSCSIYSWQVNNRDIVTIEALSSADEMNNTQKAFVESGAVRCGYCSPAMVMSFFGASGKRPEENDVECDCGCYRQVNL
ncbi:MAG: (2Fe-2S)-binding protein [Oligoflexia bacterium]|nr:(2Fe-2S)-binding protein [Oligoflexia bacterium]